MEIAAQLFTVREYMKTPADTAETFRKIRSIGYQAAQFSGAPIGDAKELRKMADAAGIRLICTHIPFMEMKENLAKVVSDHHTLGAEYAGLGGLPEAYRSEEGFVQFAKDYDIIAKVLKKEGLGATYHNHWFEFVSYGGKAAMERMAEASGMFQFLLDTYWVQYSGGNPAAWLRRLAGRVDVVHFKDMTIFEGNKMQSMAPVMEGNMDWETIISACEESGVKYYAVEQDNCNEQDPFECLRISFENLKEFMQNR